MLSSKIVTATVAVKDIKAARKFYEEILGLKLLPGNEPTALSFECGSSSLFVYESPFAGTNKSTAATWVVGGDVKKVAEALKAKGIRFEDYDFPGKGMDGDVHIMGDMHVAWFKDPDGNIHALVSG